MNGKNVALNLLNDSEFCIVDAAIDIKGTYLGTNLLVVGMDANNQIIPLDIGVLQGETNEKWSWFLTKLKECIGEDPNMAIISDRHYAISIALSEFEKSIFDIRELRPEAYRKIEDVEFEKWSRAYCLANRYNYMTSNYAESINALTKTVRKVPITMLMYYYKDLVQRWYFERRYTGEGKPKNGKNCHVDCARHRKVSRDD
ncbi:transposase, MuDR, MULE transposase domain protein [Tanacetum coccineum]